MKVLRKKIKNASKVMKLFYFLGLIFYFVSYGFFCHSILSLVGIETIIRIILLIVFGLFGLIYLIFGLTSMIERKKKVFIPLTIFVFLFASAFAISSYYIDRIYRVIDSFSQKETSTYTTVLLSLADTEFNDKSTIGMINNESNRENYVLAKELIKEKNLKNKIEYYDDLMVLMAALYDHEVDAILISKDYPVLFGNEEKYQNISQETKVIEQYSKEMKTEESTMVTTKNMTEPFTVLILGVDSENTDELDANAAFNGDTLMLVTFNPQTLNATMFSIPRDTYVPIKCNNNRYNKINAAAYGGTSCVIDTIEAITDIDIDYFVKVDFKGVVDLVEAMGGIDVEVEAPDYSVFINQYGGRLCEQDSLRQFGEHLICMDTGMQHLNGEQALAYARNRHGYLESDLARNRHQQQVLEAMAKKLVKTSSFSDFENILDTISKHIATNMKTTQILSFYQTIKNMLGAALTGNDFITIQKTYLTVYDVNTSVGGYNISALGYYQGSMDAITKAMKENLGLTKSEDIKTFAYDYATDFERTSEVIGKGIYTGSKVSFMPNFVGDNVSNAKYFANMNDLTLSIEYMSDPSEPTGIILKQSVSAGTMVGNISGFTIYVNNPSSKKEDDDDTNYDNKQDNYDNKKEDEEKENNNKVDLDSSKDNENSKPNSNNSSNNNSSNSSNGNNSSSNNNSDLNNQPTDKNESNSSNNDTQNKNETSSENESKEEKENDVAIPGSPVSSTVEEKENP